MLHVLPHLLVGRDLGISEECHGGAATQSAISNLLLSGEVLSILNGSDHLVHSEEGGQVGGVAGDDDQGEEPPDGAHYPGAGRLGVEPRALAEEGAGDEPEAVVDAELVLHDIIVHHTRMGIVPLVRRKS